MLTNDQCVHAMQHLYEELPNCKHSFFVSKRASADRVSDDTVDAIFDAIREKKKTVVVDGVKLQTFGQVFDHLDKTKPTQR
jgi:hypothetical protein